MKKQMSLFVWAVAIFGMSPVWAATNSGMRAASSADLTGAPGVRSRENVNYEKYETRSSTKTYDAKDSKNLYYTQPSKRSALYKDYDNSRSVSTSKTSESVRTTRAESTRRETKRKYYLAHPFFQPLKGKFGSVTDLAYTTSSYDITLTPSEGFTITDTKAAWNMKQYSVKEDFSYGITDRFAVLGMARFASSEYTFDWSVDPDDTMKDTDIDLWGLGIQWRFVDNAKWIATLSGYYQNQSDIANSFVADLKGGYKIGQSTIYGLVRGWVIDFDGTSYGNGIDNGAGTGIFIAYKTGVDTTVYFEGGAGLFTVLDEDWTLNLEAVIGDYDWHNQGSIKAAIGWQPDESFALNLYAKTAIFDSADNQELGFWWMEPGLADWEHRGTAKIDSYSETSVGLQAVLSF